MADDLAVVNAARVSFGKKSEWDYEWVEETDTYVDTLSKADQGLIQFLARGCTSGDWENMLRDLEGIFGVWPVTSVERDECLGIINHIRKMPSHWSPFAHTAITLHLKMPIFVARQIMKHTTGLEYNEVSRRYVDDEPEFYMPDTWREIADNVKQGSGGEHKYSKAYVEAYRVAVNNAAKLYNGMIDDGVAPEQARMILPQSMYTEVYATGNLWAWCNLIKQRTDSHAQKETQDIAKQIEAIIRPLYPASTSAILD